MNASWGLVHRWQATQFIRRKSGSPFPSGTTVCACNSLAVQPDVIALLECC